MDHERWGAETDSELAKVEKAIAGPISPAPRLLHPLHAARSANGLLRGPGLHQASASRGICVLFPSGPRRLARRQPQRRLLQWRGAEGPAAVPWSRPALSGQNLRMPLRRSSRATLHSSIISGVYRQPMSPPSEALPMHGLPGFRR